VEQLPHLTDQADSFRDNGLSPSDTLIQVTQTSRISFFTKEMTLEHGSEIVITFIS
jgi:hypothetical protein